MYTGRFPRSVGPLLLVLLAVALPWSTPLRATTVELRDIAVAPSGSGSVATITFLVGGRVETVVTERKGKQTVQIRMKSLTAGDAALRSALLRTGVKSIRSQIERRDVLVTDIVFTRRVASVAVTRRDAASVVVKVVLIAPAATPQKEPRTAATGRNGRRWALETIVIDAGHGGKDPGAIGIGGVREKDVTLAVARHLARAIRTGMPGVKVVMTRNSDRFVELYRRGQIANQQNGRFFISIHCNSMPEIPNAANGFEIYILRPAKSDATARVAADENGSVRFERDGSKYGATTDDAGTAQNTHIRHSEEAAEALRTALRTDTPMFDRGVHQAGFYVLVGALMPAALVEIGYLSNAKDVKVLRSDAGQRSIARALYKGVREFETYYAKSQR